MQVSSTFNEIERLTKSALRIRKIEEAIANRYSEQKMRCPVHLSIGQEAIAVGVCSQLKNHDYVVSNHRAHAHYLAKGGDLKRMIAEMYGKATGCAKGYGGSMHLCDLSVGFLGSTPIVGGSISVGIGAAFGAKLKRENRVTTLFLGDAATEEGVFVESLNFAALHALPVLIISENNLYSVNSPISVRQPPSRSVVALAKAHGIEAIREEGTDLTKVVEATKKAIAHIQEKKVPYLIEFMTYRFREHCGPLIDLLLPKEEVLAFAKKDFLADLRADSLIEQEIEEAFAFAEKSPFPEVSVCER